MPGSQSWLPGTVLPDFKIDQEVYQMDHCAVTIPMEKIRRIRIYINTARKSLAAIKKETGADYILNGTLYNMKTFRPNCHLKAEGQVLACPEYAVAGYAWDKGPDIAMVTLPDRRRQNYIACTPLIISGAPVAQLTYDPGQGGRRGRSAMGIKSGRLALYCTRDGSDAARTPEQLRDDLAAAGWESAVMLDGGGSSQCDLNGAIISGARRVQNLLLIDLDREVPMGVQTYSLKADGGKQVSADFKVREFRCRDGSDEILISDRLVELLQKLRSHFGKPVILNSAYRTQTHNTSVGGSPKSQHLLGNAADIVIEGVSPLETAQYVEFLQPSSGGIGVYQTFTHVDVRTGRSRWDNRSGQEVTVSGWPGYQEPSESAEVDRALAWARKTGVMTGYENGDMGLDDPVTRRQLLLAVYRLSNQK